MEEIWKDIKNYEGLYQISNLGKIRSRYKYNSRKDNKATINKESYKNIKPVEGTYLRVTLVRDKRKKQYLIHRLVAETFIPNIENKEQVNHKDGNKHNNNVNNLEWNTRLENMNHAFNNNLAKHKKIKMIDINTKEEKIFNRRQDIEEFLKINISQDLITRCCNKQRATAYKKKWEYV